jgi:hypothetical protein
MHGNILSPISQFVTHFWFLHKKVGAMYGNIFCHRFLNLSLISGFSINA